MLCIGVLCGLPGDIPRRFDIPENVGDVDIPGSPGIDMADGRVYAEVLTVALICEATDPRLGIDGII